jgi:hypothetical protein
MRALGNDPRLAIARHGPGGARRVGETDPDMKALRVQPCLQIGDQRFFTAEQMGAAGDIHEQAVIALGTGVRAERDKRRVALAPAGDRSSSARSASSSAGWQSRSGTSARASLRVWFSLMPWARARLSSATMRIAFLTVSVTTTGGVSGCASKILPVIQDLPHLARCTRSVGRCGKAIERMR